MSSNNDNQSIFIRCKNCANKIVWNDNQLCEIYKRQIGVNEDNGISNEETRKVIRRRVKAPPIVNKE